MTSSPSHAAAERPPSRRRPFGGASLRDALHRVGEATVSLGLWRLGTIRRLQKRRVARVLVYHNVSEETDAVFGISTSVFARQMRFLKRHYRVISLGDLSDMLTGRRDWVERAVAITFDDGYEDNYRIAWPILRQLELPATIYLTTDYLGAAEGIWLNRLHVALRHTRLARIEGPEVLGLGASPLPLHSPSERLAAAGTLVDRLYNVPPGLRKALTEQLIKALQVNLAGLSPTPSALRLLNWEQGREMAGSALVTFGSHGCSHSIMSRLPDDILRKELAASKTVIEREIGGPVRHFAYPNGGAGDWDPRAVEMLPELGYATAVTMCRGLVEPGANAFELPRVGYNGGHGPTLAKRLEAVELRRRR